MNKGLFNTLFNLKLHHADNPLEDYLTELFAYVLDQDQLLTNEFLKELGVINKDFQNEISVRTQVNLRSLPGHVSASKPDMIISADKMQIIFEHKVDSSEGEDQLKRYAQHLDKSDAEIKKLVYITRDYEQKDVKGIIAETSLKPNNFKQKRWFEVFHFLKNSEVNNEGTLVEELKLFMKQNDLTMNYQFKPADLIAMTNFNAVITKMDEIFNNIIPKFESITSKTAGQIPETQLKKIYGYVYYGPLGNKIRVYIGFWMNSEESIDYPEIGIAIELIGSGKRNDQLLNTFTKISNEKSVWKLNLEKYVLSQKTSLQTILNTENHINEIQKKFEEIILDLKQIKETYLIDLL